MTKTFSQIIVDCELQNPQLIKEICQPLRDSQNAGINSAKGLVDDLVRDGFRTAEQGQILKETIECIAERKPGDLGGAMEPDYYSPVLSPTPSAITKECRSQQR